MGLKSDIDRVKGKSTRELVPSGSYFCLYLLFSHHLQHEIVNFTMIPCVFELTFHLSGNNTLNAALILGVTPLATSVYSLLLNQWAEYYYRTPMICASVFTLFSGYLYEQSYQRQSLLLLLVSRILFGMAGS